MKKFIKPNLKCSSIILCFAFILLSGCYGGDQTSNSSSSNLSRNNNNRPLQQDATIYAGTFQGLVYKNDTLLDNHVAPWNISSSSLNDMVIDSENNVFTASDDGRVWELSQTDNIWKTIGNITGGIKSLALDESGNLYAGTNNANPAVYEYSKAESTWKQLGNNITTGTGQFVSAIVINDQGEIYAATTDDLSGMVWKYGIESGIGVWEKLEGESQQIFSPEPINGLQIDDKNNINIMSEKGDFWKFDIANNKWVDYNNSAQFNIRKFVFESGNIYFITDDHFLEYNTSSESILEIASIPSDVYDSYTSLVIDSKGDFYLGSAMALVVKFHIEGSTIESSAIGKYNAGDGEITKLVFDNNENLYASSTHGSVYENFKAESDEWVMTGSGGVGGRTILSSALDNSGNLYVGTSMEQVLEYNVKKSKWILTNEVPFVLVNSIVIDNNQNIYIAGGNPIPFPGQESGMVAKFVQKPFGNSYWLSLKFESIPNAQVVQSLVSDSKGNLFAGCVDGSLWKYSIQSESVVKWGYIGNVESNFRITSLVTDSNDNVYAAAGYTSLVFHDDGNVWRYSAKSANWESLGQDPETTFFKASINAIDVDSNNTVYAATEKGDIWHYDESTNQWDSFNPAIGVDILSMKIKCDTIYVGTLDGRVLTHPVTPDQSNWIVESISNGSDITSLTIN